MHKGLVLPLAAACLLLLLTPGAVCAEVTLESLAEQLSLEYKPLKGTDGELLGARLEGRHTLVVLVDVRSVVIDGESVFLDQPVVARDNAIPVFRELAALLERRLDAAVPAPSPRRSGGAEGAVVVLDPGHGGRDPGAVGRLHRTLEKEVVLAVALQAARNLREAGVKVIVTRTDDSYVSLAGRSSVANRAQADLFVSIHADASTNHNATGFTVLYPADDWRNRGHGTVLRKASLAAENNGITGALVPSPGTLPTQARNVLATALMQEFHRRSCLAAQAMSDAIAEATSLPRRGPWADSRGLYVLRGTFRPAILVELGFLSNAAGERRLRNSSHQRKLARALARGVLSCLERFPPGGARP